LIVASSLGSFPAVIAFALLVPSTAHAFCRTTTEKLPPTYNPSAGCFTEGLVLFWRNACVGYDINQAASRTIPYDDAKRVIDRAFDTWTQATCDGNSPPGISVSDLGPVECDEVRYNRKSSNQNLIVFRDDDWPYRDSYSTLGLTTVSFDADSGELRDADMEINASGHNLSVTDTVPAGGFDLAGIVTHEAGHFLGLAHATSAGSTMYASTKPETTKLRSLAQDDIDGICTIYPSKTIRSVSLALSSNATLPATACNPSPQRGLISACDGNAQEATDSCNGSGKPPAPWGAFASVLLSAVCLAVVRRRHA
jgi:hypothetical protein